MPMPALIVVLVSAWRRHLGSATRRALLLAFAAALFAGAHWARVGTSGARLGAASLLVVVVVVAVARAVVTSRRYATVTGAIQAVLLPADRALGERLLRALRLLDRTEKDDAAGVPGAASPGLARAHFERLLASASVQAVEATARRRARGFHAASLALGALALGAVVVAPMRIIEGLDVMVATGQRAPLPLVWLDAPRVVARPPSYMQNSRVNATGGHLSGLQRLPFGGSARLPAGSRVTVEGIPVRSGRQLVLTDGSREVAFTSDGKGRVRASWVLEKNAVLRVAARFGDVIIEEPDVLTLAAIPDEAPTVELEGAPKRVEVSQLEALPLRYITRDDYGLRQVDLVITVGDSEDRQVLDQLDGEKLVHRGGHTLRSSDPRLRRLFLPARVTVQARDDDPNVTDKWGKSAAITLVPPPVGQAEAQRLQTLVVARSIVLEHLVWIQSVGDAMSRSEEGRRAAKVAAMVRSSLKESFGGLDMPPGARTYVEGQVDVLDRPLPPGADAARRGEDVLLALDALASALARNDARSVAKVLARVAEEVASAARLAQVEDPKDGRRRVATALPVLHEGARNLSYLDELGVDLGSLTTSELKRIEHARSAGDFFHVALAADHLARRLQRPVPSFRSSGGGAGVEGGAGRPGPGGGPPSKAQDGFDQLAKEIRRLARDHQGDLGATEQAMAEAEQAVDSSGIEEEARRRARKLREAMVYMPRPGAPPSTAQAAAAQAAEHARAMAQNLNQLRLEDAVRSGEDARGRLAEAKRRASAGAFAMGGAELEAADRTVKEQLDWARKQLDELRRAAASQARSELERLAKREAEHGRRAQNLAGRGRSRESALPQQLQRRLEEAADLMQRAGRELRAGRGDDALKLQRQAQKLLEQADTGKSAAPRPRARGKAKGSGDHSGRGAMAQDGAVPGERRDDEAEAFRRRVLEGLGRQSGGRLAPAVRRYAEGLLR